MVNYSYAQEINSNQSNGIEATKVLNLSNSQIKTIKELNKKVNPQLAKIGRDISLSNYERAQKKKILALQHKKQIMGLLTPQQRQIWEDSYGKVSPNENIESIIKNEYNRSIKELEIGYLSDKQSIESKDSLDNHTKKNQLKTLKENYKKQKESLKEERDEVINIGIYTR